MGIVIQNTCSSWGEYFALTTSVFVCQFCVRVSEGELNLDLCDNAANYGFEGFGRGCI